MDIQTDNTNNFDKKEIPKEMLIEIKNKTNDIKYNPDHKISNKENETNDIKYNPDPKISNKENVSVCHEFSVSSFYTKLKKNKRNNIETKCNSILTDRTNNIEINPSELINKHLNEIQIRIIGHTQSAIMYDQREKILGYPITILSSFLTSAIMMSITSENETGKDIIKYISLSLSSLSFLFSVSRDYLNFSKKFQSHDLSSKLYTTLLRSIEVRLIKNHLSNDDKRDIFKDIVDQMSIIEQYETPIPNYIDKFLREQSNSINFAP